VHDSCVVRRFQRLGQLAGDWQHFVERKRTAFDTVGQVLSGDELHGDRVHWTGVLDAVNGRDVRVVERGQRLGFAREPRQPVIVTCDSVGKDFQRDVSLQSEIAGTVHFAHSAGAESIDDFVWTNILARRETHG
jgi:hypothetical protein